MSVVISANASGDICLISRVTVTLATVNAYVSHQLVDCVTLTYFIIP